MNIYVGNLAYETTEEDLQKVFAAFGEVVSAKVITDKFTGKSRGFGFVEMSAETAAKEAIAGLHETDLNGRKLNVSEARPRDTDRGGGGRRGGPGGNRGGGGRHGGPGGGRGRPR